MEYPRKGNLIFPVKPLGKSPLTKHGFKDATCDPVHITQWWDQYPDANIGMPTGRESRIVALDVDPRNGGTESFYRLQDEHGRLPDTVSQKTGGGGWHYLFEYPEKEEIRSGPLNGYPGLDIKAQSAYILVPPSRTENEYAWVGTKINPAPLPSWLRELISENHRGTEPLPEQIPVGKRNIALTSLAGSMRRRGSSPAAIFAALQVENKRCEKPLGQDELRRISESIGRYPPGPDNGQRAEVVEEPRPITRELPPAEPFPMDALGDVLGGAAQVMSEVIQAPPAMCGQSVLAAADLAVQGHANLTIDGRESPVSECFVTIGVTGERKTAADNAALFPIRRFQQTITERYEMDFAEYKRDSKAFEKATKDALGGKTGGGYDAKKRALDELGEGPVEPVKPFLTCDDPTYEGLVKLLAVGRPSFGIFSDEGGRFIGGHGMKQENQLKTAAGLSHLWDGRAISRVRAGDGAALLPGRRVSFHMMAQPEVAQLMLSNTLLLEQGLLSRCLVTWPESTVGSRFYKEMDLSASPEIRQYSARLLEVLETSLPLAEGKQNELDPRRLPLAGDAKRAWIAFHDAVERDLKKGGTLDAIKGLGNKAPEHAARLAAVLALVDDLHVSSISLEWMKAGIALMTHYLNEALRLFSAGAISPELVRAQKLLVWLQERRKKEITLVEIYRFGPNDIRDAKTARAAMAILVEHGWATRLKNGAAFEGVTRREAWRISE